MDNYTDQYTESYALIIAGRKQGIKKAKHFGDILSNTPFHFTVIYLLEDEISYRNLHSLLDKTKLFPANSRVIIYISAEVLIGKDNEIYIECPDTKLYDLEQTAISYSYLLMLPRQTVVKHFLIILDIPFRFSDYPKESLKHLEEHIQNIAYTYSENRLRKKAYHLMIRQSLDPEEYIVDGIIQQLQEYDSQNDISTFNIGYNLYPIIPYAFYELKESEHGDIILYSKVPKID